ncbi:AP-5 complex subunit sigma-1 [Salarias fasciatus]|uniref:AP-5 complex subunit sigma-1 n=1 Tax=Salarias fasciatus TaxID=181472 RepID=A0A672G442_SALFA|nr:AP-5 complex subunit sigma-1 [Salarias fasciatus]XP_029943068.1 AP-5 complex subunit sigma-1 [Salarias fasciatus]
MVLCFMIHTVCPLGALSPGDGRVLYCRMFGPDEGVLTGETRELSPEEKRLLRREKSAVVARLVQSAALLARQASGRPPADSAPGPGEESLALQEAEGGVVRLRAGEPFSRELSALWLSVHSLGFTLLCEPHENPLLAQGTLRTLTRLCLDHLHLLGPGSEVLLRSNRIDALLSRLLPHGQLLFLNHRFAQSLEKEAAAYMSK